MRARFLTFFAAAAFLFPPASAQAQGVQSFSLFREDLLSRPVVPGLVVMCHGFNCHYRDEVVLSDDDIAAITKLMRPGRASPEAERAAVGQVMAWFDRRVGPQIGSAGHVAQAGFSYSGERGQFDCIDTTHNTTLMLRQLQAMGLLLHHRVGQPVSRVKPHTTAVLRDRTTGVQWTVDGWTRGYGEVPDIMPVAIWMDAGYPPISGRSERAGQLPWATAPTGRRGGR